MHGSSQGVAWHRHRDRDAGERDPTGLSVDRARARRLIARRPSLCTVSRAWEQADREASEWRDSELHRVAQDGCPWRNGNGLLPSKGHHVGRSRLRRGTFPGQGNMRLPDDERLLAVGIREFDPDLTASQAHPRDLPYRLVTQCTGNVDGAKKSGSHTGCGLDDQVSIQSFGLAGWASADEKAMQDARAVANTRARSPAKRQ